MELREAILPDVTVITTLWKDMMILHQSNDSYFTLIDGAEEAYQKYAEDNIRSRHKYFKVCVDDEGDTVGYVLAEISEYPPIYPVKNFIEILEMAVRKDQRRKGIGNILLKDVFNWANAKGVTRVECRVALENPISQAFWKKNGFRVYIENLVMEI